MAENTIREIQFPKIPLASDKIPKELVDYLQQLENVLRTSLKGSMYIERMLEDGMLGN